MFPDVRIPALLTADQLELLSLPDKQVELVRGELFVREPPGTWHGGVAGKLAYLMTDFVVGRSLGTIFPQDTGFKIASDPDTVRAADVAFVTRERAALIPKKGYAPFAPDLVAEVVSPNDRAGEVLAKVGDWLEAGVKVVWVVDPQRSAARVYRSDGSLTILSKDDPLDGEDILPGFTCLLRQILE